MPKISSIHAHKVLNSRGNWTINTEVELEGGAKGHGEIPEGASKGGYEAVSVNADLAVKMINQKLGPNFCGMEATDLRSIDLKLIEIDGTYDKHRLGENTVLSVSIATAKAVSHHLKVPLYRYLSEIFGTKKNCIPTPVSNVINGGKHARNNLSFQEFMIIPNREIPYDKALDMVVKSYQCLKILLSDKGYDVDVGDEGGFSPNGLTTRKALLLLKEAVEKCSLKLGEEIFLGLDVASNSFLSGGKYLIKEENLNLTPEELLSYYDKLTAEFPFIYLEDPFMEDDIPSWQKFYDKYKGSLLIVGDDLTVTNIGRLKTAVSNHLCNTVIVKPNQIGTITETYQFVKEAKEFGLKVVVSHRSGEAVVDTFIADFAVAVNADYLKAGAPAHERVAKYNKVLEIYGELNNIEGFCRV